MNRFDFNDIVSKDRKGESLRNVARLAAADNTASSTASNTMPLSAARLATLNLRLIKELHHWGTSPEKICHAMQLQHSEYQRLSLMLGWNTEEKI
jgi:hypothetical protein